MPINKDGLDTAVQATLADIIRANNARRAKAEEPKKTRKKRTPKPVEESDDE